MDDRKLSPLLRRVLALLALDQAEDAGNDNHFGSRKKDD